MPKFCLSMIVRDEGHCIERCLNSCKWLIDCYRIVDTGSTDDTVDKIKKCLDGIPGEIIVSPWANDFSFHRNEALPRVGNDDLSFRPYLLTNEDFMVMMDADDEMVVDMPFSKDLLTADCYGIANMENGMANFRAHIIRLNPDLRWKYVRHEVLMGIGTLNLLRPEQIKVVIHHEGARSKNPNKGIDDTTAILADMEKYPESSSEFRYYTFLAGCCYIDCKQYPWAADHFKKYLRMSSDKDPLENRWMAQHLLAVCAAMKCAPTNEVVEAYMAAINMDPNRLESYTLLAQYLFDHNSLQSAKMIARQACALPRANYTLKHMLGWWDSREKFYQEICNVIEGEANGKTPNY